MTPLPIDSIIDLSSPFLLSSAVLFGILKALFLIALGVYAVFSLTIISQVRMMTKSLTLGLESVLITISIVHFLAAIGLWILAFATLRV